MPLNSDCDGQRRRSGVRWKSWSNGAMEKERIIAVVAIFVEVTGSI